MMEISGLLYIYIFIYMQIFNLGAQITCTQNLQNVQIAQDYYLPIYN